MMYRFREEFSGIQSVCMEIYDKNGQTNKYPMTYDITLKEWVCQCDMDVGRYKFVINDIIRLNDPDACMYTYDDNWEVWSVIGNTTSEPYRLKVSGYVTSDRIMGGIRMATRRAEYVYSKPLDIYTGVIFADMEGLHSVTYICYQPDGSIHMIEEDSIGQFEQEASDYEIVFKNHIAKIRPSDAEGMWTIHIYLDGKCLVKDYFILKEKMITNMISIDCTM